MWILIYMNRNCSVDSILGTSMFDDGNWFFLVESVQMNVFWTYFPILRNVILFLTAFRPNS